MHGELLPAKVCSEKEAGKLFAKVFVYIHLRRSFGASAPKPRRKGFRKGPRKGLRAVPCRAITYIYIYIYIYTYI